MLYIIGLGLNVDGISKFGLQAMKKCKKVYLENYTVAFPYEMKQLVFVLKKKVIPADREKVEGLSIVDEAQKMDVALLVYGSPLTATTHITLLEEAKKSGVRTKVIYNASILDAVAETGLQLYKFGKVASMPAWQSKKNYEPDSFMKIVHENMSMKAHSLILVDPGLEFPDALKQLEKAAANHKIPLKKLVVCSRLGVQGGKIHYKPVKELRKFTGVKEPYSIIIPSKLHFMEKEVLKGFE
jgi:diphthine synthase